jgi:PAS domain S-box-containing protein
MKQLIHPDYFEPAVLLEAIFKTVIDGIITIDQKGTIQLVNPAAAKLFQYEASELIGQNISMLMPEPHRSAHDSYMKEYYKTGKRKIIGIGRVEQGQRKDGSLFPIRLSISEVLIKNEIVFTGIIQDLTEQYASEERIKKLNSELEKRVEERTTELQITVQQLLNTNKQLAGEIIERKKIENLLRNTEQEIRLALEKEKELSEFKSRFVTMASHEFRTPLSTILSSTALMEHYKKEEEQYKRDKHLGRIRKSVQHLTTILNDFLSLSKLEEGKANYEPETFLLQDFCAEVIDEIEGLLKKGQQIFHESQNKGLKVYMDKKMLRIVLFNLLSNAIKYSPPNKPIYCKDEVVDNKLVLTIRDEGMGIPEKDQEHLFGRFFRASNATNIQGTGLGLNIVQQYLKLLNGTIKFESELEKGTTFIITLPIEQS